jgi:hypothetical protein
MMFWQTSVTFGVKSLLHRSGPTCTRSARTVRGPERSKAKPQFGAQRVAGGRGARCTRGARSDRAFTRATLLMAAV